MEPDGAEYSHYYELFAIYQSINQSPRKAGSALDVTNISFNTIVVCMYSTGIQGLAPEYYIVPSINYASQLNKVSG